MRFGMPQSRFGRCGEEKTIVLNVSAITATCYTLFNGKIKIVLHPKGIKQMPL
jgi:hypothetical protein